MFAKCLLSYIKQGILVEAMVQGKEGTEAGGRKIFGDWW